MNKPRLKMIDRLWYCAIKGDLNEFLCGMGYTPSDAYKDWRRIMHMP